MTGPDDQGWQPYPFGSGDESAGSGPREVGPLPPDADADQPAYLAYESTARPPRRRRRGYAAAGAVGVAAALAVVSVALTQSSPSSKTEMLDPAAFVAAAAQHTIGQSTADVVLSGSLSSDGRHLPLSGGGAIDFGAHTADIQVDMSVAGASLKEEALRVGHDVYLAVTIDGTNTVLSTTGTASWLELPLAQSVSEDQSGMDPASTLAVLSQEGATVYSLGTKRIDGVTCSGFSATPTQAMVDRETLKEFAALDLTPAQQAQIRSEMVMKPPTITMWIDSSHLLRQMDESLKVSVATVGDASGQAVYTFDHYGTGVDLAAPPASQVIPFQQYLSQYGAGSAPS